MEATSSEWISTLPSVFDQFRTRFSKMVGLTVGSRSSGVEGNSPPIEKQKPERELTTKVGTIFN